MSSLIQRLDHWLFEEYRTSLENLAIFRVLFASYVLLGGLPAALWERDLPQAAFAPSVSLAAFFHDYPPYWVMVGLNALTILCTCCLLIGWRTVMSSLGVALGSVLIRSFAYADGKIDNDIMVVLVPLTLAFSGWGQRFSVDATRSTSNDALAERRQPWLLALLALFIGLGFLSAGMAKARGGWLSTHALATRWHLLYNVYSAGRDDASGVWALAKFPAWVWKSMDFATVAWECTFVLAAARRTVFRVYCAIGAFFHLGVWLIFGITFAVNAVAYAAFVSYSGLWPKNPAYAEHARAKRWFFTMLCTTPFAVGTAKLFILGASTDEWLASFVERPILVVAAFVATGYLVTMVVAASERLRKWRLSKRSAT
jgi:hypothetical protein